jgi:hypothetical protein
VNRGLGRQISKLPPRGANVSQVRLPGYGPQRHPPPRRRDSRLSRRNRASPQLSQYSSVPSTLRQRQSFPRRIRDHDSLTFGLAKSMPLRSACGAPGLHWRLSLSETGAFAPAARGILNLAEAPIGPANVNPMIRATTSSPPHARATIADDFIGAPVQLISTLCGSRPMPTSSARTTPQIPLP